MSKATTYEEELNDHDSYFKALATLAEQLKQPISVVEQLRNEALPHPNLRVVKIAPGAVGKTTSIKVSNIDFDFGEFGTMAIGIIFTGKQLIKDPNPFWLAAGVLLMAATLYKASTKEISQQEATVFWGFIQAANQDKLANEMTIRDYTNVGRRKLGLAPLTKRQVKHSLLELRSIHSVKEDDGSLGVWQIIEKFQIGQ